MRTVDRRPLIAVFCVLTVGGLALAPDDTNAERLREIPREQRLRLFEKLKEFDALSAAEQATIRDIDRKLNALPAGERAAYDSALRRYHLWLQTLPAGRRNELDRLPVNERVKLVSRIVKEQQSQRPPHPPYFEIADVVSISPYELASRIRFWLNFTKDERDEVERIKEPAARQKRVTELAQQHRFRHIPRPPVSTEVDSMIKRYPGSRFFPDLSHSENATKENNRRRRFAEHTYFIEHPPAKVNPELLAKFTAALPPWLRSAYDPLPPDEARRRLTILYRLIFPFGSEFAQPRAATSPVPGATKPAATTTPAPKPGEPAAGSTPF